MKSTNKVLWLILGLTFIRGLIYAIFVPPWQAPDEPAQFERARAAIVAAEWNSTAENAPDWYDDLTKSLFTFGFWDFIDAARASYNPELPLGRYILLYHEIYQGMYGSRPTYAIIGWPLFVAHHQDITLQLYLVRLNTILMNVGIVLLAYLIVRTIFPRDNFLALGVPLLILFNPQHTHLLSTVNNGNLAELLATAALYFGLRGIMKGFSWLNLLAVLLFSLVAMWTKATAYFLPFAVGTVGLFYVWRHWRWWWLWISLPLGLVLAGLFYLLAPARLMALILEAWGWLAGGKLYLNPLVPIDLFRSFWALPGWFTLPLNAFWYQLLALSCLLALVGLIRLLVTKRHLLVEAGRHPQIQALLFLAVAAVVAIGILLAWNAISNSIVYRQGRSIYPVIVPICIFLLLGWRQLIPIHWRKEGLMLMVTLLFLFDTMVLFHYIIPFFYSRY